MWLLYAVGSAFFAGVTSILAKCGIRKTDSTVATAVRTIVILIFSWVIVGIVGSADEISLIDARTLVFLILSGAPREHRGSVILRRCRQGISTRLFRSTSPVQC